MVIISVTLVNKITRFPDFYVKKINAICCFNESNWQALDLDVVFLC
jgi:hypothetical protein